MNTKLILALVGVALVAVALVGVTTAQLIGAQNIVNPAQTGAIPPCFSSADGVPSNCLNSTTGQPYCYANGTGTYCYDGTTTGYCQNGDCYGNGYTAQNQNAYGIVAGMMGQTGYRYGMGHCR